MAACGGVTDASRRINVQFYVLATCCCVLYQMQHNANLLVIVIDNGVLGRVEFGFNDAKGCTISGCDWVALAKAYGADGPSTPHVPSTHQVFRRF